MRPGWRVWFLLSGFGPWAAFSHSATADEFVLTSGATLRGAWVNPDDRHATTYLLDTEHGGRVSLSREQVAEVRKSSAFAVEYERRAPSCADQAPAHWELAEWCREHGLKTQREQHLRRVVELDPDQERAWRALGYGQIGGQWVTRQEHRERQGYIYHKGKWRLPQDVQVEAARQHVATQQREWLVKIKQWRSELGTGHPAAALTKLEAIRDPLAVGALVALLAQDRDRRVRLLYVTTLGQIPGDQATAALVGLSLSDRDEEIFHACLDQLEDRNTPDVVREYAVTLKDVNNARVNRAAMALSRLGDQSVLSPLIDALITTHPMVLPGNGLMTASFPSGSQVVPVPVAAVQPGQGVLYATDPSPPVTGPRGSQTIALQVENQEVLKTLVQLTGVSFNFSQSAWRNWLAVQQRNQAATATSTRRSE